MVGTNPKPVLVEFMTIVSAFTMSSKLTVRRQSKALLADEFAHAEVLETKASQYGSPRDALKTAIDPAEPDSRIFPEMRAINREKKCNSLQHERDRSLDSREAERSASRLNFVRIQ